MTCSTGGEQIGAKQLQPFEGLVLTTARMFATQVGWEEDDMAQMLRLKVWKAVASFDPSRGLSLERHVFGAITNRIKDFKRDAAREVKRRDRYGVMFLHIEDMRSAYDDRNVSRQEAFDARYNFAERDEVYGVIEEGKFVLPAGVTDREASVLVLLMHELSKTEIALRLGIPKPVVYECIDALRQKFADWAPADSSRVVEISTVQLAAA